MRAAPSSSTQKATFSPKPTTKNVSSPLKSTQNRSTPGAKSSPPSAMPASSEKWGNRHWVARLSEAESSHKTAFSFSLSLFLSCSPALPFSCSPQGGRLLAALYTTQRDQPHPQWVQFPTTFPVGPVSNRTKKQQHGHPAHVFPPKTKTHHSQPQSRHRHKPSPHATRPTARKPSSNPLKPSAILLFQRLVCVSTTFSRFQIASDSRNRNQTGVVYEREHRRAS